MSVTRRAFLRSSVLAAASALLLLTGCSTAPSVPPTGETTAVTVKVAGMRFVPDVIEVPKGNELIVTFENTGNTMHDLVFANEKGSGDLAPGASQKIEVGVISADLDGWCSVGNHRAMGMVMTVKATR